MSSDSIITNSVNEAILDDISVSSYHFVEYFAIVIGYFKDTSVGNDGIVLKLRWRTSATAIEFFKRFYVYNSMISFDPRIIM